MDKNEIIGKIKLAIELAGDGGFSPFSKEEYNEMMGFLNAQQKPQYGRSEWVPGTDPSWKVGDILAYYECTTDHEGEHFIGKITTVEFVEEYQDWFYTFENGTGDTEESLSADDCYTLG